MRDGRGWQVVGQRIRQVGHLDKSGYIVWGNITYARPGCKRRKV